MEILQSQFFIKQVVSLSLNETTHTATVRAIHFFEGKVKYDLDVWLKADGGNSSTRIYNVDSCFVTPLCFKEVARVDGVPRRARIDLLTPAETAIRNALIQVEKVGADVKLTDAVILLTKAQDLVADYIEKAEVCDATEVK
jgi:hypothetical protein